jgi:hypothetical protein
MEKKVSEIFEGPESSLKKTFDEATAFDLPTPPPGPKAAKRIHISDNACTSCEG